MNHDWPESQVRRPSEAPIETVASESPDRRPREGPAGRHSTACASPPGPDAKRFARVWENSVPSKRRKPWVASEEVVWTNVDGALEEADDIKLEPIDPETDIARRAMREMERPAPTILEVIEEPVRFQFTLRHILIANAVIAVAFALLRIFAPSGMAGLLGIAVFFSGIVLAVHQPDHPLVTRIWYGMVTMYVVFCAYALLSS